MSAYEPRPFGGEKPAPARGSLERLIGKARPDLAAQALRFALSQRSPSAIASAELQRIFDEYGLSDQTANLTVRRAVWRAAVKEVYEWSAISRPVVIWLAQARALLGVGSVSAELDADLMLPTLEAYAKAHLADGLDVAAQRTELFNLCRDLFVPDQEVRRVFEQTAERVFAAHLEVALS